MFPPPGREQWRERFDVFAAGKTLQAMSATLPPYVTELEAPHTGVHAIGNAWTRSLFDGRFYISAPRTPNRPACSLVFVQSVDGNTEARDPSALGGGDTDKHLIYEGLSRVAADAILAGAETVRGGNAILSIWRAELVALRAALGLPRHPVQVIATRSGVEIESSLLFNVPDVPVVVLTLPEAADRMREATRVRPWITVVVMQRAGELPQAFDRLRELGIATMSCIGGRNLASQLLAANLVDDVYLTTAPRAGGVPGTPLSSHPWRGRVILRKNGMGPETGVLFEHVVPAAF